MASGLAKSSTNALAPANGEGTLLIPEQETELITLIIQGPGAHRWDDQQRTLGWINRLIDGRFGRCYADRPGSGE